MIIYTWNVNGIRAIVSKTFMKFLEEKEWDIICLQEIRCGADQIPKVLLDYCYDRNINIAWNESIAKRGYSGTAILSKIHPLKSDNDFPSRVMETEGRIIRSKYSNFTLVTSYIPNSKNNFERLSLRMDLGERLRNYLKQQGSCIFCGDLNAVTEDIDIYDPSLKLPGNHIEERNDIKKTIESGYCDAFRYKHKDKIEYSFFSNIGGMRSKGLGWRLDYFLVSNDLKDKIVDCTIENYLGSDHLPVKLEINL